MKQKKNSNNKNNNSNSNNLQNSALILAPWLAENFLGPALKPPAKGPTPISHCHGMDDYPLVKIKSVVENTYLSLGPNRLLYANAGCYNDGTIFRIIPVSSYQVIIQVVNSGFLKDRKSVV